MIDDRYIDPPEREDDGAGACDACGRAAWGDRDEHGDLLCGECEAQRDERST